MEHSLTVFESSGHSILLKDRCLAQAGRELLISMHGMSVEARGPETGTRSFCGLREEGEEKVRRYHNTEPSIPLYSMSAFLV